MNDILPDASVGENVISSYGLYASLKNQIASYLFLQTQFVFLYYEKSIIQFFTEYTAMLLLFATAAYYVAKLFGQSEKTETRR